MSPSAFRLRWLLAAGVCCAVVGGFWLKHARGTKVANPEASPVATVPVRAVPAALPAESPARMLPRALITRAAPPAETVLRELPRVPATEVQFVRTDRAQVTGKRSPFWQRPGMGRVVFPLPGAEDAVVTIDESVMLGPDRFVSTGRVDGWPASRVWFAWSAGFLHASVEDPVRGNFVLQPATAELAQLYRVEPALVPPCGGGRRPPKSASVPARSGGVFTPDDPRLPATVAAVDNPQRAEVHVLMAYTRSVLPSLTGPQRAASMQGAFDLQIAKVNTVLAASLISARVRLVAIAETLYDESVSAGNKVQDDALTALYLEDDGRMDELHALRDRVGADVVCLALGRADLASSGLSFLLEDTEEPGNARYAFSILHYGSMAGTTVVAHELGHLLGCAHDRENAQGAAGAFSFSYGYRFVGADGRQYRDLMAYPPGTELAYFSNPDVTAPPPVSVPLGIPAGRPGESNTALTIERTAFATASYRLQTQAPPNRGTLINVATRAFVGTGDDVLIGGFVVQGPGTKTLLVRAAGPALAAFGVSGVLDDPVLRIFAGAAPLAENDQWGVPVGPGDPVPAAALAQAAAQVRAFPLAPGSADAALLTTLPAGAYSAVVEGARGATGSALVEVYEVSRNSGRIINLATRGYAGRAGREMVGGFVVEGEPGTTKRVLLRVLGPSLGRAPFHLTGVLDDPRVELRNAAGELLVVGDDWSSGSEGGVSRENDFKPLVVQYDERQIFATGLAPGNRREPCLLVDLPPGSYTAIVEPFEFRSADPQLDQPAVPGVGVIEVYEIGP
ncbi:MAG: hypothetical protein JNL92_22470 [Opitutaceae bacterium]|nr:hypothetical protein [Opitutaceae bacterium]